MEAWARHDAHPSARRAALSHEADAAVLRGRVEARTFAWEGAGRPAPAPRAPACLALCGPLLFLARPRGGPSAAPEVAVVDHRRGGRPVATLRHPGAPGEAVTGVAAAGGGELVATLTGPPPTPGHPPRGTTTLHLWRRRTADPARPARPRPPPAWSLAWSVPLRAPGAPAAAFGPPARCQMLPGPRLAVLGWGGELGVFDLLARGAAVGHNPRVLPAGPRPRRPFLAPLECPRSGRAWLVCAGGDGGRGTRVALVAAEPAAEPDAAPGAAPGAAPSCPVLGEAAVPGEAPALAVSPGDLAAQHDALRPPPGAGGGRPPGGALGTVTCPLGPAAGPGALALRVTFPDPGGVGGGGVLRPRVGPREGLWGSPDSRDAGGTLLQPRLCRHAALLVGVEERRDAGGAWRRSSTHVRCVCLVPGRGAARRVPRAGPGDPRLGNSARVVDHAVDDAAVCAAFEDGSVTVVSVLRGGGEGERGGRVPLPAAVGPGASSPLVAAPPPRPARRPGP